MTQILRQSTQIKVVIGPVVAVGDGFTPVTTLSLSTADEAEILKSDAASVTDISGATMAAITSADGYYNLTLTTSHTDTVGLMTVLINDDSLCLPVKATFQVVEEAVYDALYAASAPGYLQPTTAGRTLDVTATGAAGIDWGNVENQSTAVDLSGTDIQLVDTCTTNTDMRGTDSAALASNYTATRAGYLDNINNAALATTVAQTGDTYALANGASGFAAIIARTPSATSITNMNTVFATDFATNYNTTNDGWVVKLGDYAHGGTSAAVTVASFQCDGTFNIDGAVTFGSTFAVSDTVTFTSGLAAAITGNITGNLSGSVGSVTAGVTVTTNNDKTGYALSSTGLDSTTLPANLITASSIAANAFTSAKFASDYTDRLETDITAILATATVTDFSALPVSTPTYSEAIGAIYSLGLNRHTVTATTATIYDSDNNAVATSTVSDDGTTFVRTRYS